MTDVPISGDGARLERFAKFLVRHRERIPAETLVLGSTERARARAGQSVGPGEIAEAIGVNPGWYELAESGVPTRPSPGLVDRLASVFGLDAQGRTELLELAIPVLAHDAPRNDTLLVLEAHAAMRWFLRRLNAASSVDEVLDLAVQMACAHSPETSFIIAMSRMPEGVWLAHGEGLGTRAALRRMWRQYDEVHRPLESIDRAGLDRLMGYPDVSQPGELMTFERLDRAALTRILKGSRRRYERNNGGELLARIRSRSGYVGHLFLADFCTVSSGASDRAMVAAIADLASLALQ